MLRERRVVNIVIAILPGMVLNKIVRSDYFYKNLLEWNKLFKKLLVKEATEPD